MGKPNVDSFLPPLEWFDRWWEPRELLHRVRNHNEKVPSDVLFTAPQLRALLEAHAGCRFAAIRAQRVQCSVRLISASFPDLEIRCKGVIEQFELTEADHVGRRRGDEYRKAAQRETAGLAPEVEEFSPDEEERKALLSAAEAIKRKVDKNYDSSPHLLVYVNFGLFRDLPLTDLDALQLAEIGKDNFASIWLLWGANVVRCCPGPRMKIVDRAPGGV